MLRKKISLLLAVLLVCMLGMTACKKDVGTPEDNATAEEDTDENADQEKYLIGFSVIDMENPYFITLESATREVVEADDSTLITKDPGGNADKQAKQIDEMIKDGINAIILSPVDWEKITPSLKKLKDAGVKIINVDTQVKEMSYVDAYVGSDNKNAGYICGEDLIKCGNDQLAVAAKTAVNVVGNDKVLIYGVDGSPDIKKELKKRENQIVGTAAQSPINIGKKAAETADNILDGNDYEKEVYEEVFMINKDNVDMYGTDGWQ